MRRLVPPNEEPVGTQRAGREVFCHMEMHTLVQYSSTAMQSSAFSSSTEISRYPSHGFTSLAELVPLTDLGPIIVVPVLSATELSKAWHLRRVLGSVSYTLTKCCQSKAVLHHPWLKKCSRASPTLYKSLRPPEMHTSGPWSPGSVKLPLAKCYLTTSSFRFRDGYGCTCRRPEAGTRCPEFGLGIPAVED